MPDEKLQELVDYLDEGENVILTTTRTSFIMLSREVADFVANLKYPNSERARDELIADLGTYTAELWSQMEALAEELKNQNEPET